MNPKIPEMTDLMIDYKNKFLIRVHHPLPRWTPLDQTHSSPIGTSLGCIVPKHQLFLCVVKNQEF